MPEYIGEFDEHIIVSTGPFIVAAWESRLSNARSCLTISQAESEQEKLTADLKKRKVLPPHDQADIFALHAGQWKPVSLIVTPHRG